MGAAPSTLPRSARRWLAVVLLAGTTLAAFEGFGLFFVPAEQQERNLTTWLALDEPAREQLRQAWRTVEASEGDRHALLVGRMATLSRLIVELRRREGDPTRLRRDALEARLGSVRPRLEAMLPGEGPLSERLRGRVTRSMRSLTRTLHGQGRLASEERDQLDALPYDRAVVAALDLLKREEIFLYAEGVVAHEPNDIVDMQSMTPLEVAQRMRLERRRRGLMGRAAHRFDLDPSERRRLLECTDDELVRLLRDLYAPKVRAYLQARDDISAAQIDELLGQSLRDLELTLNRLEAIEGAGR